MSDAPDRTVSDEPKKTRLDLRRRLRERREKREAELPQSVPSPELSRGVVLAWLATASAVVVSVLVPRGHNPIRALHYYHVDFIPIEYLVEQSRALFANTGRLWGYVPQYLAGYEDPFLWNSNVFINLIAIAFPSAPSWKILYFTLLFVGASIPPLFYLGARELNLSRRASLFGVFFAMCVMMYGYGVFLLSMGMLMASFASGLAIWVVGMFVRWTTGERAFRPALLLLPILPLVHKTAIFVLTGPLLIALFARITSMTWKKWAVLAALSAATLGCNWFWLSEGPAFKPLLDFSFNRYFHGLSFLINLELRWPIIISFVLVAYRVMVFAFAVWGVWWAMRNRGGYARNAIIVASSAVYLLGLAAVGEWFPGMHSARYEFNMMLFTCLLAATAMEGQRGIGAARMPRRLRRALWLIPFIAWYGWLGSNRYFVQIRDDIETPPRAVIMRTMGELPLAELRRAALYIRRHSEGRPDRYFLEHSIQTANLHHVFTTDCGLSSINGPFDGVFFIQNDMNYQLNLLLNLYTQEHVNQFNLPVTLRYGLEDFERLATAFDVRWFVVTRPVRMEALVKLTEGRLVDHGAFGRFRVFEYTQPGGLFLRGSGRVDEEFGRLRLHDVAADPQTGDTIVKYHYYDNLIRSDGGAIDVYKDDDIRAGFIRLPDPSPEMTIEMR